MGRVLRSFYVHMYLHNASVQYKVTVVVADLGWVDLYLDNYPGCWAENPATYCSSRRVVHPKFRSTQPRFATTVVSLHSTCLAKSNPN